MSDKSKIEWTEATWNPLVGCSKVSEGCRNCYAERTAARFAGSSFSKVISAGKWNGKTDIKEDRFDQPRRWARARRIFVCSVSDLFHDSVSTETISRVFNVMAAEKRHTFQILTKRPDRMREFIKLYTKMFLDGPLPNVWVGVTAENQKAADERIPILLETPAAVRWASIEPMIGAIDLEDLQPYMDDSGSVNALYGAVSCEGRNEPVEIPKLDWVVCGGESGPRARPLHPKWARYLRDQCSAASVPFLFKQWGEWHCVPTVEDSRRLKRLKYFPGLGATFAYIGKKAAGRELDGKIWDEYPKSTEEKNGN